MRLALFALIGALALPASALAQSGPKPALSVKTKAIDAEVSIDAKLRAHPGLYDNLLAEGRRAMEAARKDADDYLKQEPDFFKEGRKYSFERHYSERSVVAGRYVSVVRTDATYEGGAHPNTSIDTILWDAQAKKRISIRPFFTDLSDDGPAMTALAKAVRIAAACAKREKLNDKTGAPGCKPTDEEINDSQLDGIKPKLIGGIGPIALATSTEAGKSSGFVINYSPYAIGSYAEGPYFPFVSWTAFKDYLSPEGRAIFGGERPDGDADKD